MDEPPVLLSDKQRRMIFECYLVIYRTPELAKPVADTICKWIETGELKLLAWAISMRHRPNSDEKTSERVRELLSAVHQPLMKTEHKILILDFYRFISQDEAIAKSSTAVILGRIAADVFTFREWLENALTHPALPVDMEARLKEALQEEILD